MGKLNFLKTKSQMSLQQLYGSSHSYLQNMMLQQDHDSAHDHFNTQNIHIKDIKSKGNVDISLQELYGSSHSYLQELMRQQDHDSSHDDFHTQNIDIKKIDSHGDVDISLQELYRSSHSYLQNLGFFGNLVHGEENKVKRGVKDFHQLTTHPKAFVHGEVNKAKRDYKKAIPDVKFALHHPWKGIKWCDENSACRHAVEDFGEDAVEDAVETAAVLMNLYGSSHSYDDTTSAVPAAGTSPIA